MTPYYADESVTLYLGDCLDVLRSMEDVSIDAIITDPPYGLEFMGKDWDAPWKPEGRGGNTSGLMPTGYTDGAKRLERPSFLGSPNPTCRNCGGCQRGREGRAIRKCVCDRPDFPNVVLPRMRAFQEWCEVWAAECLRVLKPGGWFLAFGGTRTWHRLACAVEDAGFEIRDSTADLTGYDAPGLMWVYGSGFPKSLNVSAAIDKAAGAEREIIGSKSAGQSSLQRVARVEQGYRENLTACTPEDIPVTAPATPDAARWEGWGTALKPGWEPIAVARKPLTGTVAQNVLTYGTGALNVDGCRVNPGMPVPGGGGLAGGAASRHEGWRRESHLTGEPTSPHDAGRWPPNVLLGPAAAAELDRQSGVSASRIGKPRRAEAPGDGYGMTHTGAEYDDAGGASRFFPVFRYEAKAGTQERPRLKDGTAHPTVKPVDLMAWLVRLVTPPGGVVLDPFAGSGTTAEACVVEGFRCVLIEKDPSSAELIKARLRKPIQTTLFGDVA